MGNEGFSRIGLSTLDLDKTKDLLPNVVGFKTVRFDGPNSKKVGNEGGGELCRKRRVQWEIVLRK